MTARVRRELIIDKSVMGVLGVVAGEYEQGVGQIF